MFLIKKIFSAFVLPPGCLVVALAGLWWYLRKRCRPAAIVCALLAAAVWGGSSKVFSDALLRPLESAYELPGKIDGDVIVVLGGGVREGGEVYSASERLSPGSLERVSAAFSLHKATGLPLLLSGGAPFSGKPEAALAKEYLLHLGVPASKIITEEASRDTRENARYSLEICRVRGYRRPILLTSAFHMRRAALLFRQAGGEITPFPVARRADKAAPRFLKDFLPGSGGDEVRQALNEYFGLIYYRLYFAFV
ncbi:MAG TPA: YdcF family protein [Elusimicrobia bacterium]|nr:MAG: hypothetical protein A2089_11685 [Elusimicrobia bacterium GWD2_63_28]HCC46700.1 YdcF family protein [Elusimicrobiota bacterium]